MELYAMYKKISSFHILSRVKQAKLDRYFLQGQLYVVLSYVRLKNGSDVFGKEKEILHENIFWETYQLFLIFKNPNFWWDVCVLIKMGKTGFSSVNLFKSHSNDTVFWRDL